MSGLAPHHLGARRAPTAESVAGRVVHPEIRLDLAQPQRHEPLGKTAHQELAQQLLGARLGRALVEAAFQGCERLDRGIGKG